MNDKLKEALAPLEKMGLRERARFLLTFKAGDRFNDVPGLYRAVDDVLKKHPNYDSPDFDHDLFLDEVGEVLELHTERDTDTFEITLPAGYEVDDLPPPVDVDFSFASYHSKSESAGNVLKYSRTFEIKELSVPLSKMDDLKKFYRIIAGDERNTAVLNAH